MVNDDPGIIRAFRLERFRKSGEIVEFISDDA
jgi:hypothetical protein